MKRMLLLLSVLPSLLFAQNILKNGALEDPSAFALNPDHDFPDEYFHDWRSVGDRNPVYMYDTDEVSIQPADGIGLVRFAAYEEGQETQTQHLVGELSEKMRMERSYDVSFSIALDRTATHATNSFEIFFSDNTDGSGKTSYPKYTIDYGNSITNMRWRKVKFNYVPRGGEKYLHIKLNAPEKVNSLVNLNIERFEDDPNPLGGAHYYIDGISVKPGALLSDPLPDEVSLAIILDMRQKHSSLNHNLEGIKERINSIDNLEKITVLSLGEFATLHYRGDVDSLNFSYIEDVISRTEYFGEGSIDDALIDGFNSIVEFGLSNQLVFVSEEEQVNLPKSYKSAKVKHWRSDAQESTVTSMRETLNAPFESLQKETANDRRNHYSFAFGAQVDSLTNVEVKHIRAELSQLIGEVSSDDIVSLSSYNYGNIIREGISPDSLSPLFYSQNIRRNNFKTKVAKPMHQILDEIGDYKGSYDTDYHSADDKHRVIGISNAIVNFENEDYPYDGRMMLYEFESLESVTVHLAVLNNSTGTFDYYVLDRDIENWIPCSRDDIIPSTKPRKYHSYRYQKYINDLTHTTKL